MAVYRHSCDSAVGNVTAVFPQNSFLVVAYLFI